MPKMEKNRTLRIAGVFIMAVLLVVLGLMNNSYQKKIQVNENNQKQVSELLFGTNKTPGLSCGLLTEKRAEELLSVDLDSKFIQGPVNLVTDVSPDNRVFWTDNCRYSDPTDSNKYIELYINSYQTPEDAELAYPFIFDAVNNNVELPADGYGEKLIYDGGMFTLLNGPRIIQVSANKGSTSDIDTFSRLVFDEIINNIQTL